MSSYRIHWATNKWTLIFFCHRLVTKFNKKMMNEETDEEMIIPMSRTSARSPSPLTKVNSTINRGRGNGSQAEYLSGPMPQVDFSVLSAGSVKRCKKYLKIQSRPNLNKNQLAEVILRFFSFVVLV